MIRILFIFLFLMSVNFYLHSQDARQIAEKSSDAIRLESLEMVSTLKIYDSKGNVRVRKVINTTKKFGGTIKTKLQFLSPADVAGTSILIYDYTDKDDDMWVFLPATRKTRRIVSSEKGRNFMGSEFTNADMSKPDMNDFTFKLLEDALFDGKNCWKVVYACKNKDIEDANGFSKKIIYINKENFLPGKMEYYDFDGNLSKIMTLNDYRNIGDGSYFAYHMEIKNLVNGRHSEMIVENLKQGSKLKEDDFSTFNIAR
jgi:outer membrane lipoprotein-sorting protein